MRGFHLYPIVIVPKDNVISFRTTIDDNLVGDLGLSQDEVFLTQDSRDMFCCELSPADNYIDPVSSRGDLSRTVDFFFDYPKRNIRNLEKEIIITGVPELGPQWVSRKQDSATFTGNLLKLYKAERRRRAMKGVYIMPMMMHMIMRNIPAPLQGHTTARPGFAL